MSDAGPDITDCREIAYHELAADDNKLALETNCVNHQYHLLTGGYDVFISFFISVPSQRPARARDGPGRAFGCFVAWLLGRVNGRWVGAAGLGLGLGDAEQWLPWSGLTGPDWTGWANIARLLWSVQNMLLDKLVGNMHYYSHLAATLHILRDNARELFSHWIRKYGSDSARKQAY